MKIVSAASTLPDNELTQSDVCSLFIFDPHINFKGHFKKYIYYSCGDFSISVLIHILSEKNLTLQLGTINYTVMFI